MRPRRMRLASEDSEYSRRETTRSGGGGRGAETTPRRLSALGSGVLVAGVVLTIFYFVGAIAVELLVDPDEVRSWVVRRASAAVGRELTVGEVGLSVLPRPSARLLDVRVENLPNFEGPRLAHVEEVRLDVAWLPLLVGRVAVRRVALEGLGLHLVVDERGVSNFGDLIPEPRGEDAAISDAPFSLGVERVVVTDGGLNFFDAARGRSVAVTGAQVDAAISPGIPTGWAAEVSIRSDSLHAWALDADEEIVRTGGPTASLTTRGDAAWRAVDVEEGYVHLASETLAVRGRLLNLGSADASFDLELVNEAMDAAVLTAWIPAEVRARTLPSVAGTLAVTLHARGGGRHLAGPQLRGAVRFDDVALRLGGQLVVEEVHGVVAVTPETLGLDSLTGRFAGGPFDLSGVISREGRVASLVARARPDLDRLDRLGLVPGGTTLSGDVTLDLSVAGPLGSPDSVQVVGIASFDGFQAKHARFGEPLYVPAGEVTVLGQEVLWSDLEFLVGRNPLTTTGVLRDVFAIWEEEVGPELQISVSGPRLDLDALLPTDVTTDATYPQLAFAHLGGRRLGDRNASTVARELGLERPKRLPLLGTVELDVDTLQYRVYRLTSVSGRVDLSQEALTVANVSFEGWGGRARGSLELGVGEASDEPFRLTLLVERADAGAFLSAMTPAGDAVSGTLSLDLELEGTTDRSLLPVGRTLAGSGQLSVVDGLLQGTGPNLALADFLETDDWSSVPFSQGTMDFTLEDRTIQIRDLQLISPSGRAALTGLLALEGYADLSMGLSIPPDRLATISLRRTGIGPAVVERLRAVESPLELGLRLEGPIDALRTEADASSAVVLARALRER